MFKKDVIAARGLEIKGEVLGDRAARVSKRPFVRNNHLRFNNEDLPFVIEQHGRGVGGRSVHEAAPTRSQ